MSYPSPSTCPPQRVSIFLLLVNILLGLGVVGSPIPVDTPQRDYTFIHYQPPNSAPAPAPAPASASAPAPAPVAGFVHHLPPSDPASTVAGFVHREPPSAPAPAVAGFIHCVPPSAPAPAVAGFIHYVPPSAPAIAPAPASGKDYYDHPHWYSDLLVQEHELMIRPLRYSGDTENLEARDEPIQANQQLLGLLVGNWILRYKLLNSDGSLPAPREAMTLDGRLYQDDPQFREYLTRSGTQRNAQPKGSDVIAYLGDKGLAGVLTDLQNPSKFHFAIDDGRPWRPWESKPPVPKPPVNVGDLNYFTAVLDYFCSLPTTAQGRQTVLSRERSEVKKLFEFAEKIKDARIAAYNERQKVAAHSKEQEGTRK
ncbi:hypothetical protein EV361DRAFT_280328 [Lentinula raphanica]|nr:hypothetical protein EV361DRAFT_280328 [Lentinula raphanica]